MQGRDTRRNHPNHGGNYSNYGYSNGRGGGGGSGGAPRNHVIPDEPPYTAYIGNAPDSMVQGDFEHQLFTGLKVKQVRLVRDRQTDRFRGFAYVDFEDADSLRGAIALDGTFVNDRPIRIDVAVRPLGAPKTDGFRNKPGFESRDNRQNPSGYNNNNNNRSAMGSGGGGGYHQGGRGNNNYNQEGHFQHGREGHEENQQNERQPPKERRTSPRQVSNDDVFLGPDTPASNEDGTHTTDHDDGGGNGAITRQKSRNWADCPIDDTAVEPASSPPSANDTLASDDFQVVRGKNTKARNNQQSAARPMTNNPANRGRTGGNSYRGGPQQMSGGRNQYDQASPPYQNQSQQFYQQAPPALHMGAPFNNNNNNNRNQGPAAPRQRVNSNRSNTNRSYHEDSGPNPSARPPRGTNASGEEANNDSVSTESRPRLQLLPRSQKPTAPAAVDEKATAEPVARNAGIFGSGKPRDERDPKLAELNKHIEDVVEKEQQVLRTVSVTSNGSNDGVTKPVKILTAPTKSLTDQ